MSETVKLLWIGDSPTVSTGFGRVSQGVLEGLYQTGRYDISVLGINHQVGDPHRYEGMFKIYPARSMGNVYGFNRVQEVISKVKPDYIVINNDLWIASEYVKDIPENNRIIVYSPVDALPVQSEWLEAIDKVNARVVTYTEFAKNGIQSARNINVNVIGHAVDTDEFYPIDDARKFMANINPDIFIVQNVNRNQPRKRLDLFLKAMKLWLERLPKSDRENVNFYYHGTLKDVGWNLAQLAQRWGIDDRLLISDQTNLSPAQGVNLPTLCKIYNCADVHVMTSMGEGFGLSPFESAACGVAQVVPSHSACKELWEGRGELINISHWEVLTGGVNTEGGIIDVEHLVSILDNLYHNREKTKEYGKMAYEYVQREEFTWGYIARQFDSIVHDMVEAGDSSLSKKFSPDTKNLVEETEDNEVTVAGEKEKKDGNNISNN